MPDMVTQWKTVMVTSNSITMIAIGCLMGWLIWNAFPLLASGLLPVVTNQVVFVLFQVCCMSVWLFGSTASDPLDLTVKGHNHRYFRQQIILKEMLQVNPLLFADERPEQCIPWTPLLAFTRFHILNALNLAPELCISAAWEGVALGPRGSSIGSRDRKSLFLAYCFPI